MGTAASCCSPSSISMESCGRPAQQQAYSRSPVNIKRRSPHGKAEGCPPGRSSDRPLEPPHPGRYSHPGHRQRRHRSPGRQNGLCSIFQPNPIKLPCDRQQTPNRGHHGATPRALPPLARWNSRRHSVPVPLPFHPNPNPWLMQRALADRAGYRSSIGHSSIKEVKHHGSTLHHVTDRHRADDHHSNISRTGDNRAVDHPWNSTNPSRFHR